MLDLGPLSQKVKEKLTKGNLVRTFGYIHGKTQTDLNLLIVDVFLSVVQ